MIKIDMLYNDNYKEADKIDVFFYGDSCEYRGNIFKNGVCIGDYVCNDSIELEKTFSQLVFTW